MTDAPNNDPLDRARQALWAARKMLDTTPAGGTIAPQLGGVYAPAHRAYSAITAGDLAAAYKYSHYAELVLQTCSIDLAALERWLGTHDGGPTIDDFLAQVHAELKTAAAELAARA